MERRRFNRNLSGESRGSSSSSVSLQKQIAETRRGPIGSRPNQQQQQQQQQQNDRNVPDLTDFMNDMFFGTVKSTVNKKTYNLTGSNNKSVFAEIEDDDSYDDYDFDSSTRSTLTQEWLEEAKRMVASSPSRGGCDYSPSRLVSGSPRFAASHHQSRHSLDRRDPLSRSARRQRATEGFSGEILSRTAKHSRNKSEQLELQAAPPPPPPPVADLSPASAVQKWFSNILKPSNPASPTISSDSTPPPPPPVILPPRQSTHRKSRFQTDPKAAQSQPLSSQNDSPRRTFKTTASTPGAVGDTPILSPPRHLIESVQRRSKSSVTCSVPENPILSPPRNLVESANRRSISSTTCLTDRLLVKPNVSRELKETEGGKGLNEFLKQQKLKIEKVLSRKIDGKAKIVLSGPSNSTSSMVAAICYAWLLEHRMKENKEGDEIDANEVVVPVMNIRRGKMWKQPQAAWLFHHVGVDASALIFSEEVDLETLIMSKQLSILVVGEDVLKTNGEVGSLCTILTDNYCEDAYELLRTPILKKLLLAGILLDTQNLKMSTKLSMTRDAEAVQLLSVGSTPNYKNALYDQLMQDQRDAEFFEALQHSYGKFPNESSQDSGPQVDHRISERQSCTWEVVPNSNRTWKNVKDTRTNKVSPKSGNPNLIPVQAPAAMPVQAADNASRGKNKFFLARWFGFGSK